MKSNRVSRIVKILTVLQAGKTHTANDLATFFQTSRRTIFRDLKELQAIGVPFRYDSNAQGYTIDPEFFLPPIDFKLEEALSLLLLVHKARNQIQLPFRNSALLATLKIENNLPAKIRDHCNTMLRNVSVRSDAQAPMSSFDQTFGKLQKAIERKRKVNVSYHSLFEGKIIKLQLSPYHLMYNRRAWYVICFSSLHKSIRTFKLNRFREITITGKNYVDDKKFNLNEYLGRAWAIIPEGRIYNVKLRFLPMVANNVAEVQWHKTQQVTRHNDGSITVEFRVDGLGEITWWILGYGDQVQVLAPKILRKKIAEIAKNMVKLNEKI